MPDRELQYVDDIFLSTGGTGVSSLTVTVNPQTYPDAPDRVVIVTLGYGSQSGVDPDNYPTLSLGGTPGNAVLTAVVFKDQGDAVVGIYKILNVPKTSFTVTATWPINLANAMMSCVICENVDQQSPIKASGTVGASSGTTPQVSLGTVEAEELVIGVCAVFATTATTTATAQSPMTNHGSSIVGTSPFRERVSHASGQGSGAAVTAQFTLSASKLHAMAACVLRASKPLVTRGMVGSGM